MVEHPRIEINPDVMVGKPVIKGTRITVKLILRMTAAGRTAEELVEMYPHISPDDVHAAIAFAADYLRQGHTQAAE
jgi:uncharacterized protein (DUF433 family)